MPSIQLDALDLAALLCSRVCHDVISPVGAIVNGLELLEEEKDADMRGEAIGLIKRSAANASARLQYSRLAFGAAGSAGAAIDTGDAEQVARNLFANERTTLTWNAPRLLLPKNKVKVLLNLCLIANTAIPRGGDITVSIDGDENDTRMEVRASGKSVRLASGIQALVAGEPEEDSIDAHGIQAYYTGLVARACGIAVAIEVADQEISLAATQATGATGSPDSGTPSESAA